MRCCQNIVNIIQPNMTLVFLDGKNRSGNIVWTLQHMQICLYATEKPILGATVDHLKAKKNKGFMPRTTI